MSSDWRLSGALSLGGDRRRRGERTRLRNAALLLLRCSGLTAAEVARLRGRDIDQNPAGQIYVRLAGIKGRPPRMQRLRVEGASDRFVHQVLLDFLEHQRLWGSEQRLFTQADGRRISESAIRQIEWRLRRRLGRSE